jgi:predicted esterase
MRVFSLIAALTLTVGVAIAATPNEQIEQARVVLDDAQHQLDANAAAIDGRWGMSAMLKTRLLAARAQLNAGDDPEAILHLAELDAALIDQLANQTYVTLGAIRGASPALLPAIGPQKRPYVLAVYVPPAAAAKSAPLIFFLHGKGQNEADVIATPLVRSLADSTGSIVVAPYAGGDDMLSDANIADLYQALDEVENSMHVDRRRVYLAGDSLGGFAAFKALAKSPDRWTATLVIEGAVAETDSEAVAGRVRGKSIYLVAGGNDQSVAAVYVRQLASWLRTHGAVVTYYEQPDANHTLQSVAPAASKAWQDMLAGIRPTSATQDAPPVLPAPRPSQPS